MRGFRPLLSMMAAVALLLGLSATPAQAHTSVTIVAFQIIPGGYVAGYGVVPTTQVDDGPVTDGVLVFDNFDPVAHRLVECDPCGDDPQIAEEPAFDITIEPGGRQTVVLEDGTYEYFNPDYPFMRGRAHADRG